ncbi:MAG: LamG-like jellyroll fold domain-containing protein [Phycisphaerales bacterium]
MCRRSLYALGICLTLSLVGGASADLVGHWMFDEGEGTVAHDSSGNGYDGTLQGDPQWVTGKIRGALEFDGAGDYVEVPDNESLHVWERFTLAAWIYQVESRSSRIMDKITAGTADGLHLDTYPGTTLRSCSGICVSTNVGYTLNEWHHMAVTFDQGDVKLYIDGAVEGTGTAPSPLAGNSLPLRIGADSEGQSLFHGLIDDAAVFDHALTEAEIRAAMAGVRGVEFATSPRPEDGVVDVSRDVALGWGAGEFAATHDVYFGTAFDDVNNASRADPLGVLVSESQDQTAFDVGRLEFGQTYYWRVDEVNAAPDYTVFKGAIWSFTTESYGYPLTRLTVEASAAQATSPAIRTIDGSGLDELDQHGVDLKTMWVTPGGLPAWIEYTFDKVYMLHELWVWNANSELEAFMGFGAKDVAIEYSTDGQTWTPLEGVPQFAQGLAKATYTPNIVVDFGGAMAKYVKLTISDNWGSTAMVSLSEVRFFYVPMAAREPVPESGAADVLPDATLSWRAGRHAGSHQVFLGTDANNLSLVATVDQASYEADLNLGETYFWKVIEVNEAEAAPEWEGDVWSFSTVAALVVDGFESYTDNMTENKAIFQTWLDGYEVETNGSVVGYGQSPFAERTIVKSGKQSMPFFYDNSDDATIAEATRTFDEPQDWTKHGYKALSLAFYGDPNNTGALYLKINNTKVPYNGDATDIRRTQWLPWNIDLASTGVSLANVTKLVIGIEGAGAAGTLYFDDIRLESTVPGFVTPVDPGTAGLVGWYKFDGDLKDAVGANHGTAVGDAKTGTDATRGQVLLVDGIGDAVDVPVLGTVNAVTIAMWVNSTVDPTAIQFASFFHADGWAAGDLHWRYSYGVVDAGLYGLSNTTGKAVNRANQWNHVAVTVSDTEFALWLNGYKDGSQALTAVQTVTLGDGLIGAWRNGASVERAFSGKIDDARFYDRALSQEEIASLAGRTAPFAKPY